MGKNGRENNNPAFQFYPGDFWSSPKVQAMTPAEGWVYFRLLSECYQQRGLPLDMEELEIIAMSAKMDPEEFRRAWDRIIGRCFIEHEGRFWNPRALREFQALEEYVETKSDAGKAGAEARWAKERARKARDVEQAQAAANAPTIPDDSKAPCLGGTRIAPVYDRNATAVANDSPHPTPPHPVNPPASQVPPSGGKPTPKPGGVPESIRGKPVKIRRAFTEAEGWLRELAVEGAMSSEAARVLL